MKKSGLTQNSLAVEDSIVHVINTGLQTKATL